MSYRFFPCGTHTWWVHWFSERRIASQASYDETTHNTKQVLQNSPTFIDLPFSVLDVACSCTRQAETAPMDEPGTNTHLHFTVFDGMEELNRLSLNCRHRANQFHQQLQATRSSSAPEDITVIRPADQFFRKLQFISCVYMLKDSVELAH